MIMRLNVLALILATSMASVPVMAEALPGTGFIITGEGAPIVDMSVPQDDMPQAEVSDAGKARTEICRSVSVMRGSDTVYSADYVGDVDVYGRSVTSANVDSEPLEIIPDKIEIPVRFDVLKAIGIESVAGLDMLGHIGTMTVFKTGRVFMNGQELTRDFQTICNDN